MEPIRISVVLPVYNVGRYLDRCLESVTGQSYENLEILLIDDGSTDGSSRICRHWEQHDPRVRWVRQENQGLGMARNAGLSRATGKYICFFDSDDYLHRQALARCCALAEQTQAQAVVFGFYRVAADGRITGSRIPAGNPGVYRGRQVGELFLPRLIAPDTASGQDSGLWMSAWTGFYRLDLLRRHRWQFVSERQVLSEDQYSLLQLYGFVETVAVLPQALYYYCENHQSLSRTYRPDRYSRIKDCYDQCQRLCRQAGYSDEVRRRLAYPYLSSTIAAVKQIARSRLGQEEKLQAIGEILQDQHLKTVLAGTDLGRERWRRRLVLGLFAKGWVWPCWAVLGGIV